MRVLDILIIIGLIGVIIRLQITDIKILKKMFVRPVVYKLYARGGYTKYNYYVRSYKTRREVRKAKKFLEANEPTEKIFDYYYVKEYKK